MGPITLTSPASDKIAEAAPGENVLRAGLSGNMRGYREPLSVPKRPDIGIAAIPLLAVCRGVAGTRVNDRDISEDAHSDLLHRKTTDCHRSSGLGQELLLVDERPIRVGGCWAAASIRSRSRCAMSWPPSSDRSLSSRRLGSGSVSRNRTEPWEQPVPFSRRY